MPASHHHDSCRVAPGRLARQKKGKGHDGAGRESRSFCLSVEAKRADGRATGGEVFNAITPGALTTVFERIDEMIKVIVLQKQPQTSDHYHPFFPTALTLAALFGVRFTPVVSSSSSRSRASLGNALVFEALLREPLRPHAAATKSQTARGQALRLSALSVLDKEQ